MKREHTHRAHGRPASEVSHLAGAPAAPVSALSNLQTHSSHNCQRSANHFNAIMGKKGELQGIRAAIKTTQVVSPITCALTEYLRSSWSRCVFGSLLFPSWPALKPDPPVPALAESGRQWTQCPALYRGEAAPRHPPPLPPPPWHLRNRRC